MKIIFVCLGNICRSPMAEFIMKDLATGQGIEISSAGTAGYHDGEDMHAGTKAILRAKNIACDGFCSHKLSKKDCCENDLILTMDEANTRDVAAAFSEYAGKIIPICKYCDLGYKNVPDPWHTGNFEEVYTILKNACTNLLKELKAQKS